MSSPQRVAFLLLPRFSLLALSGAVEALHAANQALGRAEYTARMLSIDPRPALAGRARVRGFSLAGPGDH